MRFFQWQKQEGFAKNRMAKAGNDEFFQWQKQGTTPREARKQAASRRRKIKDRKIFKDHQRSAAKLKKKSESHNGDDNQLSLKTESKRLHGILTNA